MRFPKTAGIAILTAALFLMPLYSAYAEDSASRSGRINNPFFANQQQRLNDLQQNFDDKIAQMRDRIASREAQFKLKLDQFRDKKRAQIAERVNHNLNLINQNQTSNMTKNLTLMGSILDKVVTRTGGNASSSAQVLAAKSALTTAQNAVTTQAGKDYTISVSAEGSVQNDAQVERDLLHTDLNATRQLVISAKQAVILAIHGLLHPNASPSASGSATLKVNQSNAGLPVSQ